MVYSTEGLRLNALAAHDGYFSIGASWTEAASGSGCGPSNTILISRIVKRRLAVALRAMRLVAPVIEKNGFGSWMPINSKNMTIKPATC
jgi:hypothetical protein